MSVLVLWLSKALWGGDGFVMALGIIAGIRLVVAGIVGFSYQGARFRR